MTVLKVLTADLQNNFGNTYNQNRTSISGYVAQQLIQGVPTLTPPLVKWVDIFTDSGDIPVMMDYTENNRMFAVTAPGGGLIRVLCYTFDAITGAAVYIGKISVFMPNIAATVHTLRGLKVDDSNPAAIKIFIATTASVLVNGGVFLVNNINITDFAQVGFPTIIFGNGSNQKALYFLQDPATDGGANLNVAAVGIAIDKVSKKLYCHNGVAATHQYYVFDYNNNPNTPQTNVTISIATPGIISHAGHSLFAGDQIVFSTTGALPTGIVAGTIYFVRNPVAGVSYEIAATSGGVAINTTGTQNGVHSVYKAFGITGDLFSFKTGNLPALAGVLIQSNSEKHITPGHTINSGLPCVFFPTTTNLYVGKVSDLSAGSTLWPSLVTSNLLGSSNQVTVPLAVIATWNESLDRAVFTTSTTKIVAKKVVNNLIEDIFGILNNDYLEGVAIAGLITQFGAISISDFQQANGWTFIIGSTTGQRGVIALNSNASYKVGTTHIITKVFDTPRTAFYAGVALANQLNDLSSEARVSYRTSGFGVAAGGWILLPQNLLMNTIPPANQIQFKIEYNPHDTFLTNPPTAIEMYLALKSIDTISEKWEGSIDNTSRNNETPAYTSFRMMLTDSGTKYFRAYDDNGNLVASANTSANFAMFDKSTDNGSSWSAMVAANDYAATPLTTEIRYKWASPPGVIVTCSLGDS